MGLLISLALFLTSALADTEAPTASEALAASVSTYEKILIAPIKQEIQPGTVAFLNRVLSKAVNEEYDLILIDMDTPGGRLDSALEIKNIFMDSEIPIWVIVNRNAISAGALIALSADRIYMIEGGVIGAATPVTGEGKETNEKVVSAVRSSLAAAAEKNNRNPEVAKAMVDESISIEGVVEEGKLLTLTSAEALELQISDGNYSTFQSFQSEKFRDTARFETIKPALAENLVRILTHPIVISILLALAFWGLISEIKTAGWGIGGTLALVALGLFFWSHHLAGLAGLEGIALVVVGILLVAVELLIIPGFGVAGLLGAAAIIGGFALTIVGDTSLATARDWMEVCLMILSALTASLLGVLALAKYLPQSQLLHRRGLVLGSKLEAYKLDTQKPDSFEVKSGMKGTAVTDLRPSGIANIEGQRIDVMTQGDYIKSGEAIEVMSVFGSRIVVKKPGAKKT